MMTLSVPRAFLVPAILLAVSLACPSARAQGVPPGEIFVRRHDPLPAFAEIAPGAAVVSVDRAALQRFRRQGGGRLALPLAGGSGLILDLRSVEVLAPGARVTLTGRAGPVAYRPDVTILRGSVEGEPGSLAVLGLTARGVTGTIQRATGLWVVAPLAGSSAGTAQEHFIADAADLPGPRVPFECASDELAPTAPTPPAALPALPRDAQSALAPLVCRVALECDHEYFLMEEGDSAQAVGYALLLLATSSAIYERELNVKLQASYLNVWTTEAEPYSATTKTGALDEFAAWWRANRQDVSRDVAQLLSDRELGGGAAYRGELCNRAYAYSAISDLGGGVIGRGESPAWAAMGMAHELGHIFGSYHTHSCWWQANGYAPPGTLLDTCYAAEGGCVQTRSTVVPPDKGTIMSYCHLLYPGMANVRLDFHPACRSVMRATAEVLGAEHGMPARLALRNAFPNPANTFTWVWGALPFGDDAWLELLDPAGRLLRSFRADGPGMERVELDGLGTLAPGCYFVRLVQAGRTASTKLVVIH